MDSMITGNIIFIIWLILGVGIIGFSITKKVKFKRTLLLIILLSYVCCLVAYTFFPIPTNPALIKTLQDPINAGTREHNFQLFTSISKAIESNSNREVLKQLGGNLILLMPLTFILPLLWDRFRSLKELVFTAVIVSLGIETGQFMLSALFSFVYWTFDVDDLLLNITGAIIMSLVVLAFLKIYKPTSNTKLVQDNKQKK